MQSFAILVLLALFSFTSALSTLRILEEAGRHDDDTEYDSPNPPYTEAPTGSPTEAPTGSPTDDPSQSPTDVPSLSPTDVPSLSPTVSPSADRCNLDSGSFGNINSSEQQTIVYEYEMDTSEGVDSSDVLGDVETEITNILIRTTNPICASTVQSQIPILGIRHISIPTADCAGPPLSGPCFKIRGQMTLYLDETLRRILLVGQDVNDEVRGLIQADMNNGELAGKVDGVTQLTWIGNSNPSVVTLEEDVPEVVTLNQDTDSGIGFGMLAAAGVLLIGGYGTHRYQRRRERKRLEQQRDESDENFVEEIA